MSNQQQQLPLETINREQSNEEIPQESNGFLSPEDVALHETLDNNLIDKIEGFGKKWEQVDGQLQKNKEELKELLEKKQKEIDGQNSNENFPTITVERFFKKRTTHIVNEKRFDVYGNEIIKGQKKHKLAFDENVLIFQVENWKKYNEVEEQEEKKGCCNICKEY